MYALACRRLLRISVLAMTHVKNTKSSANTRAAEKLEDESCAVYRTHTSVVASDLTSSERSKITPALDVHNYKFVFVLLARTTTNKKSHL